MGSIRRQSLVLALVVFAATFVIAVSAGAAPTNSEFRVLLDIDNSTSTGCFVDGMSGVDRILITTIESEGTTGNVTGVKWRDCAGTLTTVAPGPWNAGVPGQSGNLIVETFIPYSVLSSTGTLPLGMHHGFVFQSGSQSQSALEYHGASILYPDPTPPKGRIVEGPDGKRTIVLDGKKNDWGNVQPAFEGGASAGTASLTLRSVHVWGDGTNLYFMMQGSLLPVAAPIANDDGYSTNEESPLVVGPRGVLENDTDADGNPLPVVGVTASEDSSTSNGGLTLNSDGSFTYTPNPNFDGNDSFTYHVNDDHGLDSNTATATITVNGVNDAPVNTVPVSATTAEDTALAFTGVNNISVADVDANPDAIQVTLSVTNGTLSVSSPPPGTTGNGTATLTMTATVAALNAALNGLTFQPALNYSGPATLTITTSDLGRNGSGGTLTDIDSVAITVTAVNDAPVVVPGAALNYTENQGAVALAPALTVTDVDSANLASATVQITGNYVNGQDVLAFAPAFGITGVFTPATGTLALTGSTTVANWQTALRSVTYQNTSDNPSTAQRTVTWIASDGSASSTPATSNINITAVNDAPVLTAGATLGYTENQAATAIDGTITIADLDSATLASATAQITGNYANGQDVLAFAPAFGITGVFAAGSGTLTLTGSATLANWQTALRSVTYANTSDNPSALQRTVTWQVNDGALANNLSNTPTSTINVTPVNDPPTIDVLATNLAYTEDDGAVVIDNTLTVADPDDANLTTATIQITANYVNGQDILAFTNAFGITGLFDAPSGTLTLTGPASPANFQSALRTVTYTNTSGAPSTATRTLTWTVNDPAPSSGTDTSTITITSVNDEPSFTSGGDVLADSTPGTQVTFVGWATAISPGPPAESAQNVDFVIDNFTNPGLFTTGPAVTPTGTLTFTPVAGATGTSTVTLHIHDDGGIASGGDDASPTQTFVITLDASPAVTTTSPTNGTTNNSAATNITINFNEPVNATGASFTIACGVSGAHTFVLSGGPSSWTLNPDTDFTQAETCTVTVIAAQITDADANDPPNNMLADYVFSFSMDAAPTVTATTPTDTATTIATNTNLTIDFSEPVTITNASVTISCANSGAHTVVVSGGPTSWTVNPDTDFANGELCTVTVLANQVSDNDGNDPPDSMLANHVFSFTTDTPPSVTATTPTNGSTSFPATDITVTFNEPVNATGASFTISCGTSGVHPFALTGGPTTFTLNPDTDFVGGETCTVTALAAQVTDQDAGDPPDNMAVDSVFSFNVDAAPTVTTTTPTNGAPQVASNTDVTINFSESVNATGASFTISCGVSGSHTFTTSASPSASFTLNPNVDFTQGETCTVTVLAAGVTDADAFDPPDNMAADYVFSFTIDAAPFVSVTTPANGAINQAANTSITVGFSEPVNAAGTWATISCTVSGAHAAVLSGGPTSFTIDPSVDFTQGETCTVTVLAAQITDVDGIDPPDNMLANSIFSFSIDAAPGVTNTIPADTAMNIATNSDITIDFSESVSLTSAPVTINCATSGAHNTYTVSGSPNTSFTINPSIDFAPGELCTVVVLANQVSDTDANDPPDNMTANYTFTFTTDFAPSVTATTPTNGSIAAPTANLTITFSEPVDVTGSWFSISCGTTGTHTAVVTGGPTTFTLNPDTDFVGGETCTVNIFAAQVTDQDANDPPNNMIGDYTFSFTVDAAPAVTTTTPTNGAPSVASNTNVTINFDESVNATGASFTISCGVSGAHAFSTSASPSATFTLNPTVDFTPGETCTVTVLAAGITDADLNDPPDNMAADYVFSFTVDSAPSVTNTTPADTATGVTTNANISLTFSESVSLTATAVTISCATSGAHTNVISASPNTTFTVNPNVDFSPGELCTVTVLATQVSDTDAIDPPDNMAANYIFTFTTDAAPSVTATTPTDTATGVATNANISLTFNESVSLTASAVTISCASSGAHTNVISASPNTTFTVNPDTDFVPNELCTVTVLATQVTDTDANDPPDNMTANYVFSFTTDAAPSVTATTPANGATSIAKTTNIDITFSEPVNVAGNWFQIVCGTQTKNVADTLVTGGPTTFTINPTTDLQAGNVCQVTVFATQVTDQDGNDPPDNMLANYVFSFSVPPEAVADDYKDADGNADADPTVVGNVGVNTANSTNFSILTNDAIGPGVTINLPGGAATTNGGIISVAADGKFTYTPPAGFEGVDTFAYNISNASGTSASVLVTINVSGMIWFINAAGGGGDGRLGTPFNTLASFQAVNNGTGNNPAVNDNIFIYENAASYTGPVTLLGNQKLIGQDATATLVAISGVSSPPDTFALPAMNTGAPATTINSSAGGVNAVNLNGAGSGNTIRGMTITTGNATAGGIVGTTFGTLTVSTDVTLSGSGPALFLTTGSLSGNFNSISSSGGTTGISLTTIGGSSNLGTGALSGHTSNAFFVSGGTVTLTYGGSITNSAGRPVSISGKISSGDVTFDGSVNGTSNGVLLDNNDGATIRFRGGLTLNTGTLTAFSAINGGTVAVCDEASCDESATGGLVNTLTTTTGTALNVVSTTIGVDKLEFRSISANGATKGISLNATGANGLIVTGTGTTDGSGGTVQNCTQRGAEFVSSSNITLKNMTFTNNGVGGSDTNCGDALGASTNTTFVTNATCESNVHLQSVTNAELNNVTLQDGDAHGLNGVAVNGLTLTNVEALRNGDQTFEKGVQLVNLSGTVNVTGGIYRDNAQRSFEVQNNTGAPTITFDGAFFGNTNFPTAGGTAPSPSNSTAGSTILIATNGSSGAAITTTVRNCTINKVFSIGAHFDMASGTNSQNVTFGQTGQGNIVTTATQGISITGTNSGGLTASIVDNAFSNDETLMDTFSSTNINIRRGGGGTTSGNWNVTIDGNDVGISGNTKSGCETVLCFGISADDQGSTSGTYTVDIQNNNVYNVGGGIQVGSAGAGAHTVRATVMNNTVQEPDTAPQGGTGASEGNGIIVFSGSLATATTFARIEDNNVDGGWDQVGNGDAIRLRHAGAAGSQFFLCNFVLASSAANVATHLATENPLTSDADGAGATFDATGASIGAGLTVGNGCP